MFHLCCAAPAAPDMAHHPANHGFSPLTSWVGPPLPQGWAHGSEAAEGVGYCTPGRMKTHKG